MKNPSANAHAMNEAASMTHEVRGMGLRSDAWFPGLRSVAAPHLREQGALRLAALAPARELPGAHLSRCAT